MGSFPNRLGDLGSQRELRVPTRELGGVWGGCCGTGLLWVSLRGQWGPPLALGSVLG